MLDNINYIIDVQDKLLFKIESIGEYGYVDSNDRFELLELLSDTNINNLSFAKYKDLKLKTVTDYIKRNDEIVKYATIKFRELLNILKNEYKRGRLKDSTHDIILEFQLEYNNIISKVKNHNIILPQFIDNLEQDNKWLNENKHLSISEIREKLLNSHDSFCKFMFSELEGTYLETRFDKIFNETIDKVFKGEIKRLIINIPVGMGKTARGVIAFVARGFAINARSRFLNISYDNTLVLLNSAMIRDFIQTPNYKMIFGDVELKNDTTAKGMWKTTKGGALRATSSGGSSTGYRAGNIGIKGFSGAMIIDDPLKPDDANSKIKMEYINNRYENTFKSRLAKEDIPIIVIMQRIHPLDFTNHLISKYGKEFHHLIIPALVETDNINTEGTLIPHGLDKGAIWEERLSEEDLLRERDLNPSYFYSQLQQEPTLNGGSSMLNSAWIKIFNPLDDNFKQIELTRTFMFCDTANKTGELNDYTVFSLFTQDKQGNIYLIAMLRDKLEFQDLILRFTGFVNRFTRINSNLQNVPPLTNIYIEDKASGTSLIQVLRSKGFNIIGIPRSKDKIYRLSLVVDYIRRGFLHVANRGVDYRAVEKEFDEFTDTDTHAHDDILDTVIDGVYYMVNPIVEALEKRANRDGKIRKQLPI